MKDLFQYDVIVIGGGAAGMMAAGCAGKRGKRVLLLEQNPSLGKKLKITGGGRCNITNAEFDTHSMLERYGASSKFLYSAFSQFGVKDTFSFFERQKLPLVVQENKRAFPHTQRAIDVFAVLKTYVEKNGVTLKTNARVSKIIASGSKISEVVVGNTNYSATSVILSTGGLSHPETGSTGMGFEWLKDLGHTVHAPTPTIVPLRTKEAWSHALAGISIPEMKITFFVNDKKAFSKKGKILLTHFGLSGPLILNSAGEVGDLLHSGIVTAAIDLYPNLDEYALEQKIIGIFDANKNKTCKNILPSILPVGTARGIGAIVPIDLTTKVHSITKEERKLLVRLLKAVPLTILGLLGYDKAVVADGGVPLSEIDMRTMRSARLSNLYITGDLLDIKRPSGGFSLQLCWTTGFVAGTHC